MHNKYSTVSLRGLYELKALWEDAEIRELNAQRPAALAHADKVVIEIKQEIRLRNRPTESRIIATWGDWDGWMEVVACPAWVKTKEDAEEFFYEELDLPPIRSAYDCTGKTFVSWYKVGKRCGQWVVYVRKGLDV